MSNSHSTHSRALRRKTANAALSAKLASGEYRQMLVRGKAEDMDVIDAALAQAGGSRVQALKKICAFYMAQDLEN